jgi:DNA-directed RNA polymerase subunit RPC12/RpoP
MPKVKHEFYCTECSKYFDIKLNMGLDGNYRIHCPNCGHVHYRAVSQGKITEQRFPHNECKILIEDIRPMRSSCRDSQTETELDSEYNTSTKGFMHRLWAERHSCKL